MLSTGAWAQEAGPEPEDRTGWTSTINNDFEIRYWIEETRLPDPADVPVFNYVEQVNRLNLRLAKDKWAFDAQIDEVALFANRYRLDDVLTVERPVVMDGVPTVFPDRFDAYLNIEKFRATYEDDWGLITAGDFYAAFGRGIVLNLNRNVDIDLDTSIQGAKAFLRPGAWDIQIVAGQVNRQQVFQDNPNSNGLGISGDLRHAVGGVSVARYGLGPANLSAHGAVYNFTRVPGFKGAFEEIGFSGPDKQTPVDAIVGGATAELVGVGGVDWFIEGDLFHYGEEQPADLGEAAPPLGHAVYASAAFYPGPLVFLVEAKRYYQAERINAVTANELYEIAIAPTLEYERSITEDSSAGLNSSDVWGGRLQVDWGAIPGELAPSLAIGVFRDDDVASAVHFNEVPETIIHPLATIEWIKGDLGLIANVGHRWDIRDGTEAGSDRHLHGDVSFNFPIGHELLGYISGQSEWYRWGVNPFQQTDYVETETGWTLAWGSKMGLTWYMDHTTNPIVDTTGNLAEPLYGALEFQVKPNSGLTLKALYGAQKSGIRCSGGQCRTLPGFSGVRFSMVGTF